MGDKDHRAGSANETAWIREFLFGSPSIEVASFAKWIVLLWFSYPTPTLLITPPLSIPRALARRHQRYGRGGRAQVTQSHVSNNRSGCSAMVASIIKLVLNADCYTVLQVGIGWIVRQASALLALCRLQ